MYFQDIITTVFEPTLIKVGATVALSYGFLFGNFHSQAILAVLMLMVFDTLLGAYIGWQEGNFTSRKFGRVLQKGVIYFMSISAGYFADLTTGISIIQSTMIAFIGVTEFISILENMGRMGFQTPKKLLNQLKDFQSQK